jgi:hypothetical protein
MLVLKGEDSKSANAKKRTKRSDGTKPLPSIHSFYRPDVPMGHGEKLSNSTDPNILMRNPAT